MQLQGNEVYFTPLLEYQNRREGARPSLSIKFFTELEESKDTVLMRGQLTPNSALALKDAQHLVYQLQLFYIVGKESHWSLVKKFHNKPSEFDYNELINMVTTLDDNIIQS